MIAKIFDTNNPLVLIIIFIAGILFWVTSFIHPAAVSAMPAVMPLYNAVCPLFQNSPLAASVSAFILLFLEAVILNQIIINNKLLSKSTYLTAMIYIILMSSYKPLMTFTPVLVANLFLLISLNRIFDMYDEEEPFAKTFNIGFFASVASLFYFPSLYFIVVAFICLIIFKFFNWRVWIIFILGILTPYFLLFSFFFLTDKFMFSGKYYLDYFTEFHFVTYSFHNLINVYIAVLGIISLYAVYYVLVKSREKLIKTRLSYLAILWFLIISIIFIFINKDKHTIFFVFTFIPLSIIISNLIQHLKKEYIKEIIMIILFLIAILLQIYI